MKSICRKTDRQLHRQTDSDKEAKKKRKKKLGSYITFSPSYCGIQSKVREMKQRRLNSLVLSLNYGYTKQ